MAAKLSTNAHHTSTGSLGSKQKQVLVWTGALVVAAMEMTSLTQKMVAAHMQRESMKVYVILAMITRIRCETLKSCPRL